MPHFTLKYSALLSLLLLQQALWAASPVVGRSDGTLAVQAGPTAGWRVIAPGGILPDVGEARTSADAPAHLQTDHGTLSLGPLSHITFDLPARRVQVISGRVFCAPAGDQTWVLTFGTSQIEVPADSGVEIQTPSDGILVVSALHGPAVVTVPDRPPVTVPKGSVRVWDRHKTLVDTEPIGVAAKEQLLAWTKQLPPGQGVGQLLIKDSQEDSGTRLNIARYHAEVVLQPPVALVKLDQSFYNPSSRQQEGEFVFNLPPGASVSRFAMYVTPESLIEGEVIERQQADQVYTTIVSSRRDPAILEQIGDNLFKMRVFPIFPKDVKRILLHFTLPLDGRSGQYQMQLPLLSDLKPIWDFRLFGSIQGPTPLASVLSPTFPDLKFASTGNDEIRFDFTRSNYQPTADFLVAFQQQAPESPTTYRHLLANPLVKLDSPESKIPTTYFDDAGTIRSGVDPWRMIPATYFQADLPSPVAAAETSPADVVILADTSANGTLDRVRPALRTVLDCLRDKDRFRLVCVDVIARPISNVWAAPRSWEAAGVATQFDREFCMGTTDMLMACEAAAAQYANQPADRRRIVIYIGDGVDSIGRADRPALPDACASALRKVGATLFAVNTFLKPSESASNDGFPQLQIGGGFFQFGRGSIDLINPFEQPSPSRKRKPHSNGLLLLQRTGAAAGGRCFDISGQPAEQARFFEWLLAGLPLPVTIKDVKVAGADPRDVYVPSSVLPGESLRVTGRIKQAGPLDVSWTTRGADGVDQPHTVQLKPQTNSEDHLVGRYWADQRLRQLAGLLSARHDDGGDREARQMIVELSREWSILVPQTAFLVLETEQDYITWGVPRQARRPYWSQEALPPTKPLPAEWLANIAEIGGVRVARPQLAIEELQLQVQLDRAKEALEAGQHERALRVLSPLQGDPLAEKSDEYRALLQLAEQSRRDIRSLQGLGIKQAWFDLGAHPRMLPQGLDRLFVGSPVVNDFLLQRHPLAEVLMQEVDLPGKEMTVREFARYMQQSLGINVDVDTTKLEEEGIESKTKLPALKLKRISALHGIRWLLKTHNLTALEEPHRLVITTIQDAYWKRQRALFSIQDLVSNQPRFEYEDLLDPIADRNDAVGRRIQSKLDKPVTWKFQDESLEYVVERLQKELEANIFLDKVKLEEESIAPNATDINCNYENMPVGEVLRAVMDQKNLTYKIEDEVIVLTTKSDGIGRQPLQFYPVSDLLFRDIQPGNRSVLPPRPRRPRWPWRGGFGGMGGFFGGGGMVGGMGGMGGGGMGGGGMGGGGMGGGGFGMGGGGNLPAGVNQPPQREPAAIGVSDAGGKASSETESDALKVPPKLAANEVAIDDTPGRNNVPTQSYADELIHSIEQQTGGPPDSPWIRRDGDGGDISFYAPGMCLVLRQTTQTHEEITDLLQKLRTLHAKRGHNPEMVPVTLWDLQPDRDSSAEVRSLIDLVLDFTGGPPDATWQEADGDGGVITYNATNYSLNVFQPDYVLDDINALLVRLRRERYSLLQTGKPWSHELLTTATPGLINGPWLAPLTPNADASGEARPDRLAALQVRRELPAGQWQWSDTKGPDMPAFTVQTDAERLRMTWPGWEIRAREQQASVTLTGLEYCEVGNWGRSLRDWLDVQLVFWPHRTNRQLAALFDVTPVAVAPGADPNQVRLRFVPAKYLQRQFCIEVVYDKTTGLPVVWESFRQKQLAHRYRFQAELTGGKLSHLNVQRETPTGEVLGRGTWTVEAGVDQAIAEPDAAPAKMIVVDRRPVTRVTTSAFERGLHLFRQEQYRLAVPEFRAARELHPNHPLVGFLWAWSLDQQPGDVSKEDVQRGYAAVIPTTPTELLRFLNRRGSRHLTRRELYTLLSPKLRPLNQVQDEVFLAKLMLEDGSPGEALVHANAARNLKPSSEAEEFEILQAFLEASVRTGDFRSAIQKYEAWSREKPRSSTHLSDLLAIFERHEHGRQIVPHLQELLRRPAAELPMADRRSLLKRLADAQQGISRWETLLQAAELLPDGSKQGIGEVYLLMTEVQRAFDAPAAQRLATQAKYPHNRQRFQIVQAELTANDEAAQEIYWKLHEEGYLYYDRLATVCERFNASNHPDRTVIIAEAAARSGRLTHSERLKLATAYEMLHRPLDVIRASAGLE